VVDFVFMDPPFGSNIFYADSSLLWEAWLGALTPRALEMVVSTDKRRVTDGKDLSEYGALMAKSFSEASRVLRKGGRGVLAFSNSDDDVWEAVLDSLSDAGLTACSVHVLDKGQPSIKGVKGLLGQENVTRLDLMLCLERVKRPAVSREPATREFLDKSIKDALESGSVRTDEVYSLALKDALSHGLSVHGITMPSIAERCVELGAVFAAGKWSIERRRDEPPVHSLVDGYLAEAASLPKSVSTGPNRVNDVPTKAISGGRNSATYLAHSYHTKVPPEAIVPFIEHFTKPGDVVLDPFCGSGMTGVAAMGLGRKTILNDLSPAAVHLSWNHTRSCDPDLLSNAFDRIEQRLSGEFSTLYSTTDDTGKAAKVHWTLWSTTHRCPDCSAEFALWDTFDRKTGRLGRTAKCPRCGAEHIRRQFAVTGNVPVWVAFESEDGRRRERVATGADIALARATDRAGIATWWPNIPLGPNREMYNRCALHLQGIESVADMYTARNLKALSLIWHEIEAEQDDRLKRALAFAFTNTAWHGTRMRRFNARGGQRPLTGTLYVPQLSSEANVMEVMRNKIAQLRKFYESLAIKADPPAILLGSATSLPDIASGSVDYVFTDPPFGSNIFYADCNLIWESWLGRLTEPSLEAVVNRSLSHSKGGKDLVAYASLMTEALREISRVLKPGGWATIVFHNTDAAVWEAIQGAARSAGFEFHEASSLERKQQSHKGYKGREGFEDVAHFDVVMNLRKPAQVRSQGKLPLRDKVKNGADIDAEVRVVMRDAKIVTRGVQGVHAEMMRRRASSETGTFVSYGDVRASVERVLDTPRKGRRRASGT
jgi:tRNA G10  N-methylase Trm11